MKNRQASSRVRPQFEELEPRILYSADATALLHPDAITSSAEVRMLDLSAPPVTPNSISQTATINSEVVFVDTTISNYQQLIDDIKAKGNPDRHIEIEPFMVFESAVSGNLDQKRTFRMISVCCPAFVVPICVYIATNPATGGNRYNRSFFKISSRNPFARSRVDGTAPGITLGCSRNTE